MNKEPRLQAASELTPDPTINPISEPILKTILEQWPLWSLDTEPVFVRELSGGLTNKSYLLQSSSRLVVLRINHFNKSTSNNSCNNSFSNTFNIDRATELAVHQATAKAGLSPAIIYTAPNLSYWLRDFIDGTALSETNVTQNHLNQMAKLLKIVHSLPINDALPRLNITAKAGHYLSQTTNLKAAEALRETYSQTARPSSTQNDKAISLCHMDPLPANWIDSSDGRLWLIDWEYAAVANPALDIAALWLHIPEELRPQWEDLHSEITTAELHSAIDDIQLLEASWHLANATSF